MTTITDLSSTDATAHREHSDALVLVQDHLVISSYAGDQIDPSLDLARVLCRALGRPVEIYRVQQGDVSVLRPGTTLPQDRAWATLAVVHPAPRGEIVIIPTEVPLPPQQPGA